MYEKKRTLEMRTYRNYFSHRINIQKKKHISVCEDLPVLAIKGSTVSYTSN